MKKKPVDVTLVMELREQGLTQRQIAAQLDTTKGVVSGAIYRHLHPESYQLSQKRQNDKAKKKRAEVADQKEEKGFILEGPNAKFKENDPVWSSMPTLEECKNIFAHLIQVEVSRWLLRGHKDAWEYLFKSRDFELHARILCIDAATFRQSLKKWGQPQC